VRHKLVTDIVDAYTRYDEAKGDSEAADQGPRRRGPR
jgi:hypothetical protein